MAMGTFVVFAASYDTLGAAKADYHAVRGLYEASGLIDTYDAAVITGRGRGRGAGGRTVLGPPLAAGQRCRRVRRVTRGKLIRAG